MAELRNWQIPQMKRGLYMKGIMKEELSMLELPTLELSQYLREKCESNPLVEIEETFSIYGSSFPHATYLESMSAKMPISFYDHLLHQMRMTFKTEEELKAAQEILEDLDDHGFYPLMITSPLKEKVIAIIKSFDPVGVAAKNLKESLLLQLANKNKKKSLAYTIIEQYFDVMFTRPHKFKKDLFKKGLFTKAFCKKIPQNEISKAIKEIASLCFNPRKSMENSFSSPIYPDIFVSSENNKWKIELAKLPKIKIKTFAVEKEKIKTYLDEAKWFLKILEKRKKTLIALTSYLLKHSNFQQKKSFLCVKQIAKDLNTHPSTIYRALKEKYLQINNQIVPFSSLINKPLKENKTSKQEAIAILKKLLQEEKKPLSDKDLVTRLCDHNIKMSRRTVAKYRQRLQIASSYYRTK